MRRTGITAIQHTPPSIGETCTESLRICTIGRHFRGYAARLTDNPETCCPSRTSAKSSTNPDQQSLSGPGSKYNRSVTFEHATSGHRVWSSRCCCALVRRVAAHAFPRAGMQPRSSHCYRIHPRLCCVPGSAVQIWGLSISGRLSRMVVGSVSRRKGSELEFRGPIAYVNS